MASISSQRIKVIVIGAGIIGLSSAVVLAENVPDADVHVIADQFASDTTSSGAAGLWAPDFAHGLKKDQDKELKLRELAIKTWHHARALSRYPDAGQMGVFILPYYKVYYHPQNQARHWWKDIVPDYRRISNEEIKTMFPGVREGYVFSSVIMDCSHYLPYLQDRLVRAGGRISKQKVASLHEVEAPWIHYALEVEPAKTETDKYRFYVIPRCNEVILGGTQHNTPGVSVSSEDREAILTSTALFVPSLKNAKFKGDWAGLRPNRSTGLRLEKETITSGSKQLHVIHNYGHSGQGITLHWGCALEAAKMAAEIINKTMVTSKL
ncbi:D-amino-acid oxidase isoform X2 [Strongylocentrotus purpuratus]|uniref:FAD dependent oxidoreductase domain-containing protein n=1 Tax=Strongylocentrotus purpuratus TaxID=7668 RepID=A0A7M7N046_STRPU|nr:D-amino-acid oxidase isoform X2 [Strongylocentrotus purpuratus]